jgi:hypothetical protein
MMSTGSQIAAVDDEIGCDLAQVGKNCVEGAAIAVNVRYYGDSHFCARTVSGLRLDCYPTRSPL